MRILLFGLIAAMAEFLGGATTVLRPHWSRSAQQILLALGAGFILALVFIDLIPASLTAAGENAPFFIMLGFALSHFFEHTLVGHLHFGEETHADVMVSKRATYSAITGLSVHAFFDGFAISVGMQFDFLLGFLIAVAVILHKFPEGLTLGSIMIASGAPRKSILGASGGLAVATLLGVVSALSLVEINQEFLGYALAVSAGIGTYVGASDLIPEINKSHSRIPPLIVFAGMVLLMVSERLLEEILR